MSFNGFSWNSGTVLRFGDVDGEELQGRGGLKRALRCRGGVTESARQCASRFPGILAFQLFLILIPINPIQLD